jgi:5-methylcytosine-specific restriction endonuclease McrA
MARTVKEWIGASDDQRAPPRIRQRIFDRDGGVCHICKLPIKPGETWQADHVVALINGGGHRETNLAPAHSHCHVGKTVLDVKEKAKVAKVRGKHTGAIRPKQSIKSAGFPSSPKSPRIDKSALPPLPLPPLMRSVRNA